MEYYVEVNGDNGADGSKERPWGSIGWALASVEAGDTVRVGDGVFYEAVVMDRPEVWLMAVEGARPVIDGRYGPELFGAEGFTDANGKAIKAGELPGLTEGNAKKGGWVFPGSSLNKRGYHPLVKLVADGVVIDGFVIRNSSGRAVIVEGDGCELTRCRIDFTYGGAVGIASGSVNSRVTECVITRSSMKKFDATAEGAGPDSVQTTVIIGGTDTVIEDNTGAYNFGEFVSADKGSIRPVIRRNVIHTNNHWGLGFNYTSGAVIEGNVVYWCDNLVDAMGKTSPADLFVGGSERASVAEPREAAAPDMRIVGNLFVGGKRGFVLGGESRPVQFVNSLIKGNTVVGRVTPGKARAAFSWTVLSSAPHKSTVVEKNVIVGEEGVELVTYQAGGEVVWGGNLYSSPVPRGMSGEGDVVTNEAVLRNPFAPVLGQFDVMSVELPDVATTFDLDNYRPLADGPAVGRGALGPVVDEPGEPSDPPVPDYGWLVEALEGEKLKMEKAKAEMVSALLGVEELIGRLEGLKG